MKTTNKYKYLSTLAIKDVAFLIYNSSICFYTNRFVDTGMVCPLADVCDHASIKELCLPHLVKWLSTPTIVSDEEYLSIEEIKKVTGITLAERTGITIPKKHP